MVRCPGERRLRLAKWCAFAAAALFTVSLLRFAIRPGSVIALTDGTVGGALLAAAPHVLLLIGVWPVLPVPRWASTAGLVWLLLDLTSDVLAVAGASPPVFLSVRYAGHLFAAVWIGTTALCGRRWFRGVGLVLAVLLGGYSLVAAWVAPVALAPAGPLLVLWWFLVGRRLDHELADTAHLTDGTDGTDDARLR